MKTIHIKILSGIIIILLSTGSLNAQLRIVQTFQETKHKIFFADYSPDGKYIVTTGSDYNIIIWNSSTATIYRTLAGLKKRTNTAVFTHDNSALFTAGEDKLITIWNPGSITIISTLEDHKGAVKSIDISPDDKLLASGGEDKIIRIWDVEKGILIRRLLGHEKVINAIKFSHDGRKLISGSADKTLKEWDISSGRLLQSTTAHNGWIRCLSYSPDDRFIATGGDDNMVNLWRSTDLQMVVSLSGHTDWVQTLDFSPDGVLLVSGGHDQQIILWDLNKKKMIQASEKQGHIILSTKFSPDTRNFLSCGLLSEKLQIWEEKSSDYLSNAYSHENEKEPEELDTENETIIVTGTKVNNDIQIKPTVTYPQINIYSPVLTADRVSTINGETVIVGRINDPEGINALLLNKVPVKVSEIGVFEISVGLKKGENEFELVALNNIGMFNRREFIIECTSETTINSKTNIPDVYTGNYHALIIAVNEYDDPNIVNLYNPLRDAEKLQEVLINKYTFDPEYIHFLKNPTRMEIIMALDKLSNTITEKDNLLIFYAGHGYWDKKGGVGYWLPKDAMNSNTANWFRNSTMRDFIGSIMSKHTILIADACFSGSIFKSRSAFPEPPGGITKLYGLTSRKAMTSGTLEIVPDESIFLKYLIKRLDENKQKFLSSEELFSSMKTAVLNNSPNVPQFGTIQNVGDEGGDFIFIRR